MTLMTKRYPRGIMATACIPWTKDYQFDEKLFRGEVSLLCDQKIKSIYLFGTAGEGYSVSNRQFSDIVRAFGDETKGREGVRPMVGIISLSPDEILERIEAAGKEGITDFQISFPAWGAVSDTEAMTFLHYICDRFPEFSFMHYNNGLRSRKKLGGAQYARIAEELPNLVAVKHTAATLAEICDLQKRDLPLQFFFLEDAYAYASLMGEASLLISFCNINYRLAHAYFEAGKTKDRETLMNMVQEFSAFYSLLGLLPGGLMDGAYDKLYVKYSIPEFPQRLYPPYEGVTEEQFAAFDKALREAVPGWFS